MSIAPQRHAKHVSADKLISVSFVGELESGELLTGTPTVVDNSGSPSVFTLSSKAINTAQLTINGRTVAIGKAIQFKVVGGVAGAEYVFTLECDTNATPAQHLVGGVVLDVVADPA